MKSGIGIKIISLSTVLVGALSIPAIAGGASTYVENSYSIRNIFSGLSETKVRLDSTYRFDRKSISDSLKQGTTSSRTNQSASGDVDGFWVDQSFREVDKFNIYSRSNVVENGWGIEKVSLRSFDSYQYNGFDKTHRVTSGFGY